MNPKTFQELRDQIAETRIDILEYMADHLQESTEFERGLVCGELRAYDRMGDILRNAIKYEGVE